MAASTWAASRRSTCSIRWLDTSRVVCALPAAEVLEHLSAVPDGRLVAVLSHQFGATREQSLALCTPSTGAVEHRSLPRGIGRITAPLIFAGGWLYGATYDAVEDFAADVTADLAQRGGALIRLSLETPLPLTDTDADGLPEHLGDRLRPGSVRCRPALRARRAMPTATAAPMPQELADGTHPRGVLVRHFAEGATGTFFHTRFDIANPTSGASAFVLLRFLTDTGEHVSHQMIVPAVCAAVDRSVDAARAGERRRSRRSSRPIAPIAVDRTMTWDASGYGSHIETGDRRPGDDVVFRRRARRPATSRSSICSRTRSRRRSPRPCATCGRSGCRRSRRRTRWRPASRRTIAGGRRGRRAGEHRRVGGDHRDRADRRRARDVSQPARAAVRRRPRERRRHRARHSNGSSPKAPRAPSSTCSC